MKKIALPIDPHLPELLSAFGKNPSLVISAEPGTGKTTRIPAAFLAVTDKKIAVLVPRRIAAQSAAARIAEEENWVLGGPDVGYQVRFENRSSSATRLIFMTEALLLKKMSSDPKLSEFSCIILDEFHERSLHTDLGLALLRELQELERPDLKILVMSATLDSAPLARFLKQAQVFEISGKKYPIEIEYERQVQLLRTGPDFTQRMTSLVQRALRETPEGDLLVFLPGKGEITRLHQTLQDKLSNSIVILDLHGSLSLAEQRLVLHSAEGGKRRIILSTNVAESSLTVPGVRVVVDSGLARIIQRHPKTKFQNLSLSRISKASARQRAGRAARLGPGFVYRAWTTHDEISMRDFDVPEIHRVDLCETVLTLATLGISNPLTLDWFDAPAGDELQLARNFLMLIEALSPTGLATPLSRELARMPLHPRYAFLVHRAREVGQGLSGVELAVLLSQGREVRSGGSRQAAGHGENDLFNDWLAWTENRNRWPLLEASRRSLCDLLKISPVAKKPTPSDEVLLKLLFEAFPDRLCRRRRADEPSAKMVGGRGVRLRPESSVKKSEYFLALEISEEDFGSESQVSKAVGLPANWVESWLKGKTKFTEEVRWLESEEKMMKISSNSFQDLPIGGEGRSAVAPDEVFDVLVERLLLDWPQVLERNPGFVRWKSRLDFLLSQASGVGPTKDVNPLEFSLSKDSDLSRQLAERLAFGEVGFSKIKDQDVVSILESLLSPQAKTTLQKFCPSSWTVPTGNQIQIRYTPEQGPHCEVRLQELFGLSESPMIAGKKLTLFLLAPNYNPVQVTSDLASFWKTSYFEVRKEMRSRYPKHSWPEDPLSADPVARGRPRRG